MPTPSFFRHMAQRCCELLRRTTSAEVREQLLLWAADFNAYARSAQATASATGSNATPRCPPASHHRHLRPAAVNRVITMPVLWLTNTLSGFGPWAAMSRSEE